MASADMGNGSLCNNTKLKRIKKKSKIEEYFDEHLTEILPDSYQNGDVVSSERLLAFANVIMATCSAFLVVPIRNLISLKNGQTLFEFMYKIQTEVIMFFLGFAVILAIWENINIRVMVIKRIDDIVLTFAICELLITTALPFSLALQGHYPFEIASTILTCCILGLIQIIDIVLICYAISSPRILHIEMQKWSICELRKVRTIFLIKPIVSFLLVLAGGLFCFIHFAISWSFIAALVLMPTIRNLHLFIRQRIDKCSKMEKYQFYFFFSKGRILKDRVKVMSDTVIAIVACILILDITEKNFPSKERIQKYGLLSVLDGMKPEFLSFLSTFVIIFTLWYVNHIVLHMFRTVTAIMLHFQKAFLALVSLCPLLGSVILGFSKKGNEETKASIRVAALVVFCSSSSSLLIFLYGLLTKKKYLLPSALNYLNDSYNYFYIIFNVAIVPVWSIFCALGTIGTPKVSLCILYISFVGLPLSFFISKLILVNFFGNKVQPKYIEFETYDYEQIKKNTHGNLGKQHVQSNVLDSIDNAKTG
ncbi:endosomal/lysosomal proton channel TMEM175-like [Hydra vulgaris]|uniref:Endosomal/lysosomal proton channel TMEM175 n=1 Tax=Hydra vulgaris TaxID=6087 RepID=A0ABM4DBT1_HYDVU